MEILLIKSADDNIFGGIVIALKDRNRIQLNLNILEEKGDVNKMQCNKDKC